MGMGISIKLRLLKAQKERDEHKAAAIVFYQIACDLCGVMAVKAEYERRLARSNAPAITDDGIDIPLPAVTVGEDGIPRADGPNAAVIEVVL